MSLFLRRRLQQYIDDMDGKIPRSAMKRIVKALNGGGSQPLGTEWEVVLLWAFSRRFHVDYEPGHANASKLDLAIHDAPTSPPLFVADVRCVSDSGYHEANPVDRLSEILGVLKAEANLSGEVGWNVTGAIDGEYRKGKMILHLPRGEEDWEELTVKVREFYTACARQVAPATLPLFHLCPGLSVAFNPRGRGLAGGYPSYVATYNIRRNPVANALGSKRDQLLKAGTASFCGTILCDGGCDLLHTRMASGGAVSLREVVMNFLNHETEVDFVVTLAIESSYPNPLFGQPESHVIKPQFFSRLPDSQVGAVYQRFNTILPLLPRAETSPENARNWYVRGSGHEGHRRLPMQSSANDVKVSARWLLELLAGRTTVEEAFRQYNIDPQSKSNPFRQMLNGGRLPEGVTVMRNEEADDNTIALRFGPPDAAIAPFRTPPPSGDSVQR